MLSRADIGIAMGAMGSDAAIEAADVVLMDDDPLQIAKAIGISRKCIGIVRQNIVFSLVVKFACLALTALGYANMWAAIFADVGVMIIAVLNAIARSSIRVDSQSNIKSKPPAWPEVLICPRELGSPFGRAVTAGGRRGVQCFPSPSSPRSATSPGGRGKGCSRSTAFHL